MENTDFQTDTSVRQKEDRRKSPVLLFAFALLQGRCRDHGEKSQAADILPLANAAPAREKPKWPAKTGKALLADMRRLRFFMVIKGKPDIVIPGPSGGWTVLLPAARRSPHHRMKVPGDEIRGCRAHLARRSIVSATDASYDRLFFPHQAAESAFSRKRLICFCVVAFQKHSAMVFFFPKALASLMRRRVCVFEPGKHALNCGTKVFSFL